MAKKARGAEGEAGTRATVHLTKEANEAANRLCETFGMKKRTLLHRVLVWLDGQDDWVKHAATRNLIRGYEVQTLEMILTELKRRHTSSPAQPGAGAKPDVLALKKGGHQAYGEEPSQSQQGVGEGEQAGTREECRPQS
jgi:hypothetical protein